MEEHINKDLRDKLILKRDSAPICRRIIATAPSSSANCGSGFDVFGLALDLFHDTIEIELADKHEIILTVNGMDEDSVSKTVRNNTAGRVASIVMETARRREGLKIALTKGVPVGKGLGSSASSAVACSLALNEMFGLGLTPEEQVGLAGQGEKAAAGSVHYDNVAASTLGGFVIVSKEPKLITIKPPKDLRVAMVVPSAKVRGTKTKTMRELLPRSIPLQSVTSNIFHASQLIAGMTSSDIEAIGKGMADAIVEPVRSKRIPMFFSVRKSAIGAGASGVAISGAGPTIIAICDAAKVEARKVANAMRETLSEVNIESEAHVARPAEAARVTEKA